MAEVLGLPIEVVPLLLSALAMGALGVWLISLNPRSLANWGFGIFLLLRMAAVGTGAISYAAKVAGAGEAALFWRSANDYASGGGLLLALLAFLSVYPRPRAIFRGSRAPFFVFMGLLVARWVLLVVDHSLLATYAVRGSGPVVASIGPLAVLGVFDTFAIATFVLARDLFRENGSQRRSLFLIVLGFAVLAASDLGGQAAGVLPGAAISPVVAPITYGLLLTGLPLLAGVAWMSARAWRNSSLPHEQSAAKWLLFSIPVVLAASFAVRAIPGMGVSAIIFDGVLRLVLPVLGTWAIVRHQLFDIDLKVRWTVRASTVGAVFLGVFLIVAQLAQNWFNTQYGWAVGGVAAGLALVALHPIQRFAERVANAAVPSAVVVSTVAIASGHASQQARDAYRAAVDMALADRVITRAEERALAKLAGALALSHEEALEVREAAERDAGLSSS